MLPIQIAVGVHHLRLDPQAEVHSERMDSLDERLQAAGKFPGVDDPVAESRMVIVPRAEPAIVHDEALYPDP